MTIGGSYFYNDNKYNDKIVVPTASRSDGGVSVRAVYDNTVANLTKVYYDANGHKQYDRQNIVVPLGTTWKEFLESQREQFDAIEHTEQLGFQNWEITTEDFETLLEKEIGNYRSKERSIEVVAKYEKLWSYFAFSYVNEEGKRVYEEINAAVTEGTTFREVFATLDLSKMVHHKELGFVEWELDEEVLDEAISENNNYMYMQAKYANSVLTLEYPDKTTEKIVLDAGAVYDKLPTTYKDAEIVWTLYDIYGYEAIFDANKVEMSDPCMKAVAKFVNDVEEPEDTEKPEDTQKPEDSEKPEDTQKPEDSEKPEDTQKPEDSEKPEDTQKPEDSEKPEDTQKPEDSEKPEDTQKPVIKLENEVIVQKVEEIAQAQNGTTLIVDMKKEDGQVATEVPAEILKAAKGKDMTIVLDMGAYTWTIHGGDIKAENPSAINLEVKLDTQAIAPTLIHALAKGEPTRQLSLTHNGNFGFKASLNIHVGSEYEGKFGNLYYHDSTGKLVFMNAGKIDENGNVSCGFSHASDYVIVIGDDRTAEETQDTQDTTQKPDNSNPNTSPNTGNGFGAEWCMLVSGVILLIMVVERRRIYKV